MTQETFKQKINLKIDTEIMLTSIDELKLTCRAYNILNTLGVKTLSDLINLEIYKVKRTRNAGIKTIKHIEKTITDFAVSANNSNANTILEAIELIFSDIVGRNAEIFKKRYGFIDGKSKTLDGIGLEFGITKERVRQIVAKELKNFSKHKKYIIESIIEQFEELLYRYKGVVSINDIMKEKYFLVGNKKTVLFIMKLMADFKSDRYAIVEGCFLVSLDDNGIHKLQKKMYDAALECDFPIEENKFIEFIKLKASNVSEDYICNYLMHSLGMHISNGKVISLGALSLSVMIGKALNSAVKPLHVAEIVSLIESNFHLDFDYHNFEHVVGVRLNLSPEFINVGLGKYMLRKDFLVPTNINYVVREIRKMIIALGGFTDTVFILNKMRQNGIDVGKLNKYSLKPILLEYPDFHSEKKFGISRYVDSNDNLVERKNRGELIVDIFISKSGELNTNDVWKILSKQFGVEKNAVSQILCDDRNFIRVRPGMFTIEQNISMYQAKKNTVLDFSVMWLKKKEKPISTFLISEVLNQTDSDKEFPIDLVEYILSTSSQFENLKTGYYILKK